MDEIEENVNDLQAKIDRKMGLIKRLKRDGKANV